MRNANKKTNKGVEMKTDTLYKLYVNNENDLYSFDINKIDDRINEIKKQWINANEYGFSYWTDKKFPTFKIEESI